MKKSILLAVVFTAGIASIALAQLSNQTFTAPAKVAYLTSPGFNVQDTTKPKKDTVPVKTDSVPAKKDSTKINF